MVYLVHSWAGINVDFPMVNVILSLVNVKDAQMYPLTMKRYIAIPI